jgi:hypothetical protein
MFTVERKKKMILKGLSPLLKKNQNISIYLSIYLSYLLTNFPQNVQELTDKKNVKTRAESFI